MCACMHSSTRHEKLSNVIACEHVCLFSHSYSSTLSSTLFDKCALLFRCALKTCLLVNGGTATSVDRHGHGCQIAGSHDRVAVCCARNVCVAPSFLPPCFGINLQQLCSSRWHGVCAVAILSFEESSHKGYKFPPRRQHTGSPGAPMPKRRWRRTLTALEQF